MKKVKNILFKMELEGNGVVNCDSNGQKWIWNEISGGKYETDNNLIFAKKNIYQKSNGEYDYKIKISSNCLRHNIFIDDIPFQSPNILHNNYLLVSMLASPAIINRGHLFALNEDEIDKTIRRKSVLCIIDAEQTNNCKSKIELMTVSGEKISDTSLFNKETVGDITYETDGNIDLMQMQFISCSKNLDRLAFNPDLFPLYSELLKKRLPSFNSELKYYRITNSVVELPEYGFLLSNTDVVELTKNLLYKMLKMNIYKSGSSVVTSKLKIKLVYDVFNDKKNNSDGWIELTKDVIDNLNFENENFYTEYDFENAKTLDIELSDKRSIIIKKRIDAKLKAKDDKKEKKEAKLKSQKEAK